MLLGILFKKILLPKVTTAVVLEFVRGNKSSVMTLFGGEDKQALTTSVQTSRIALEFSLFLFLILLTYISLT